MILGFPCNQFADQEPDDNDKAVLNQLRTLLK
ncbi:hypothetical protein [Paenibacillus hexagrammi]